MEWITVSKRIPKKENEHLMLLIVEKNNTNNRRSSRGFFNNGKFHAEESIKPNEYVKGWKPFMGTL